MPRNTIRTALADALEDLSKRNFDKFRHEILDRREEPIIRRNRLEGKNYLEVVDVLVGAFTESVALQVTVDTLRQIDCNEDADALVRATNGLR